MQPTHIDSPQSHLSWLPQKVPHPYHSRCHMVSQSKPCIGQGAHDVPPPRNSNHAPMATQRHSQHTGTSSTICGTTSTALPTCPALLRSGIWCKSRPTSHQRPSYTSDPSKNADQGPMANVIKDDTFAADSNISALVHLRINKWAHYTMTLPRHFLLCHLQIMCVFILCTYHYETNAILALPIANLEGNTIFEGYRK
jgi:hypothetical protein